MKGMFPGTVRIDLSRLREVQENFRNQPHVFGGVFFRGWSVAGDGERCLGSWKPAVYKLKLVLTFPDDIHRCPTVLKIGSQAVFPRFIVELDRADAAGAYLTSQAMKDLLGERVPVVIWDSFLGGDLLVI